MSRIRSLKPEWLDDERLCDCSLAARVLSIGLILLADDYGRGRASPSFLARRVALDGAAEALAELEAIGFVHTYTVDGQSYFAIRNWSKHQRVDNAGKPIVPAPVLGTTGELPGAEAITVESPPNVPDPPDSRQSSETFRDSPQTAAGGDLDQDQESKGEEGIRAPAREPSPSPIRTIFEAHVEAWRAAGAHGTEPRLTDSRRKLIRDRLKDHPVEALEAAARGVFTSKYHAETGRQSIEVALANAATIEELAAKHAKQSKPVRRAARPEAREPVAPPLDVQANAAAARALTANLAAAFAPPQEKP